VLGGEFEEGFEGFEGFEEGFEESDEECEDFDEECEDFDEECVEFDEECVEFDEECEEFEESRIILSKSCSILVIVGDIKFVGKDFKSNSHNSNADFSFELTSRFLALVFRVPE
jgi:hypothetical protein